MIGLVIFFILSFLNTSYAAPTSSETVYYGENFYQDLQSNISNDDLKSSIKTVLRSDHRKTDGLDEILVSCTGAKCYRHISLGYDSARVFLMGEKRH